MSVHNLKVSTENLLNIVVQMPEKEFARFFKNARQIKEREANLIKKIESFNLSPEKEKIYRQLLRKFRAEKISPEEHKVLIEITDELEGFTVEKLKCLVEITKIRNSTIDEVMKELNIKPKSYE